MKTLAKIDPKAAADEFARLCREYGWTYAIRGAIVTISKRIRPGSMDDFRDADMEYGSILDAAPLKGGSVWGTDGGGIGAISAINQGRFVMNKSGSGARFLSALSALK